MEQYQLILGLVVLLFLIAHWRRRASEKIPLFGICILGFAYLIGAFAEKPVVPYTSAGEVIGHMSMWQWVLFALCLYCFYQVIFHVMFKEG
jgi:hypothetical protein